MDRRPRYKPGDIMRLTEEDLAVNPTFNVDFKVIEWQPYNGIGGCYWLIDDNGRAITESHDNLTYPN